MPQHFIRDGRQSRMCWSGVAVFLIISIKCWRYFVNVILMAISPAPESNLGHPLTGLAGNSGCRRTDSHRAGCAETILLFANHRHFLHDNQDWSGAINQLRRHAPEKKIVVEADTPKKAIAALRAQPDVLQLDKFSPQQATEIAQSAVAKLSPLHAGSDRRN